MTNGNFKNQTFGMELEMVNISRPKAAEIIANYFNTNDVTSLGGVYDTYTAKDQKGRVWKCMNDSSLDDCSSKRCEMVTPILKYDEDMEDLQNIVRLLRTEGAAISNPGRSCGIHIHIGLGDHDIKTLKNLVNFFSAYQDVIYRSLKISPSRYTYCKKLESVLVDKFNQRGLNTMAKGETAWYGAGYENGKLQHYHMSRYHGLNLHSVFSKGTIEFRLFNGTLHAGKIRSYILFCLASSQYALDKNNIHRKSSEKYNDKYTMLNLLKKMGLRGDEYKVIRHHLTENLEGKTGRKGRYIQG